MIFVCGDIHRAYDYYKVPLLVRQLNEDGTIDRCLKDNEPIYIICTGDFGFIWNNAKGYKKKDGFGVAKEDSEELQDCFNSLAEGTTITFLFLDGNHENFDMLNAVKKSIKWGGYVQQVAAHVYHLMRGEIYTLDGLTFLTIGGGLSVDKKHRTEGKTWWPQEELSQDEANYAMKNFETHNLKVDYILSHTCPQPVVNRLEAECLPAYDTATWGQKTDDPTTIRLTPFALVGDFKAWIFGHFHIDHQTTWHHKPYYCQIDNFIKIPTKAGEELEIIDVYNKRRV